MVQFKPIKPRKIYEQIVEQIKAMIAEGNLKPGDRLPSEREMSDRLKVSRASVREALSALHLVGLVEIKPGDGAFIKQTNIDSIIEPLALALLMERNTDNEILEVRKGLEVEAAGLAALRRSDDDLAKMRKILDKMKRDTVQVDFNERADMEFHCIIAKASQNVLIARLMNAVSDTIGSTMYANRLKLYSIQKMPEKFLDDHEAIYEAIKNGDSMEARKKMFEHLLVVKDTMMLKPDKVKASIDT